MDYQRRRKGLLKDKAVRAEHEKLLPEYELTRSIIEQRIKKKMTQVDMAKKTGMPQSTIARIEGLTHGRPRLSTLTRLAQALDAAYHYDEGKEDGVRRDRVKEYADELGI